MIDKIYIIDTVVKAMIIGLLMVALGGFTVYLERKVLGFLQNRLGPMMVGAQGVFQLIPDILKLFFKEDIVPSGAIKPVFKLAPVLTASAALVAFVTIPILPEFTVFGYTVRPIVSDLNVGLLFTIGVAGFSSMGALLGGLGSTNKWALLGAGRALMQTISYESITSLAILAPIMIVGSLSIIDINNYQAGSIGNWLIWKQPVAFILFLIAGFAETNRTPFDLLDQEEEIVAGYTTDYTGMRFGLFFIGEYIFMLIMSFLVSFIFLGGFGEGGILGAIFIIVKVSFFMFFLLWVRASWPHVRPDQLMWFCWKVLFPIAILNLIVTALCILA